MTWLNYRFSDGETTILNFVYDYGTFGLWSLLLWTNHLYYVYYWESLGRFYLLDIHCDYSLISPLCGVAPTPDCGIIISAFSARGVIQTLVWHQYYYFCIFPLEESFRHSFGTSITILHFSARGVIQTLVWHPVFYFGIFLSICVHHGFSCIFVTDVWSSIKSGVCWIYYTRVLNVCEYIQTYSLACPWLLSWPDCLAWRYASRWQPRNLRCWRLQPREDRSYPGQLFLWEMESHRRRCFQPLPPSTLRNQVLYSQA